VGGALAARLAERGLLDEHGRPDLYLLCVPDAAIAAVARNLAAGPWVAHVSGATPLGSLDPHRRRFSLHPLQTFSRERGPEQIDGAWGAVTAERADARDAGWWLAETLGLRAFDLADDARAVYHAGASIASNFLVTLHRAAARALACAEVPAEALVPLMRRTIDNNFDLTGPIARGDTATVDAHLAAIQRLLPDLEPMYRALAEATRP
jgi:predicted short-subunit dehydrogenase-like oxidoreductase (DUF2520 family)